MKKDLQINFIGCGKLGKALGKLIGDQHIASIAGIVTTSLSHSQEAVAFIGQGKACRTISELPAADIYFLTTPDREIQSVTHQLLMQSPLKTGDIVVHCAGALSSDILNAVKERGCYTASVHPLKSFANPLQSTQDFKGTICAIEGDPEAILILAPLFEKIGAKLIHIDQSHKKQYHAASVLANNYLVSLHYQAIQCFTLAGVDEKIAKEITQMLMTGALSNLQQSTHTQSLTGPIHRGDLETVNNHIQALNANPLLKNLYTMLGLSTLPFAALPDNIKKEFENLFNEKK